MAEIGSECAALLDRAEQAHRNGRFAQVRTLLGELGRRGTAAEQQRAEALRARLRPDPLVAVLLIVCLVLFVSVIRATWR
jgi:hypothetical protein